MKVYLLGPSGLCGQYLVVVKCGGAYSVSALGEHKLVDLSEFEDSLAYRASSRSPGQPRENPSRPLLPPVCQRRQDSTREG